MRKLQALLNKDEEMFFKKLVKALGFLQDNPKHNSLASHEITELSRKYGIIIFQSYLATRQEQSGFSGPIVKR